MINTFILYIFELILKYPNIVKHFRDRIYIFFELRFISFNYIRGVLFAIYMR